ncbi:MAG: DUF1592 domain-containing protein [Polyangiaceae bacterium]
MEYPRGSMRFGLLLALTLGAATAAGLAGCESSPSPSASAGDSHAGSAGVGGAGGTGGSSTSPSEYKFTCDTKQTPDEVPLRRLSKTQYLNTLRDVVELGVPGSGDLAMSSITSALENVPDDLRKEQPSDTRGGFRELDQVVHQEHIDASFDVAQRLGTFLTRPERLGVLLGACSTDNDSSNDDACADAFIQRFGERVLRRPLESDDLAFFRGVYDAQGINSDGLIDVITVMLTSPEFLYFVEHGDSQVSGDTYALSAFELASRLSYHFWQTTPDDELFDAAKTGALLTEDGYDAQVTRLSKDPRAKASIESFFGEWLWLDDLPKMNALVGTPVFDAFAGDSKPTASLRDAMVNEVLALAIFGTSAQTAPSTTSSPLANRLLARPSCRRFTIR